MYSREKRFHVGRIWQWKEECGAWKTIAKKLSLIYHSFHLLDSLTNRSRRNGTRVCTFNMHMRKYLWCNWPAVSFYSLFRQQNQLKSFIFFLINLCSMKFHLWNHDINISTYVIKTERAIISVHLCNQWETVNWNNDSQMTQKSTDKNETSISNVINSLKTQCDKR